jgi:hypothetical protein
MVGESITLSVDKTVGSRWRLFESKRRVNSSFFSCIAGISSPVINGGDILGWGSAAGTVKLDDGSVCIGGKGVYDARIVSVRLSHTVLNVSSRRSCVESSGIPGWRWKIIDDRRLQALLKERRQ